MKKVLLIAIFLYGFDSNAQQLNWFVGSIGTTYQFTNSSGKQLDYFKPEVGSHYGFSLSNQILDSTNYISKSTSLAIYFANHPRTAKVLQRFIYEIGPNFNQYNAVGDVQNIPLVYRTNFIGLNLSFGPDIPIYKGFVLSAKGLVSAQKIISGNQQIGNNFFPLADDPLFKPVFILTGYAAEISKILDDRILVFATWQKTNSGTQIAGNTSLSFATSTFSFGIRFRKR